MIQKLKAKANSKKGFTLAELLVVVGIIAVLVAIAIPTFSAATKKATDAVHKANCRSAYAEAMVAYISGSSDDRTKLNGSTISYTDDGDTATYKIEINGDVLSVTCSVKDSDGKDIVFKGNISEKGNIADKPASGGGN